MTIREPVTVPTSARGLDLIEEAVRRFGCRKVFALFSGGDDSLTATHLVSRHERFWGAVHINTGIGVEDTRHFVRETCKQQDWPLIEYHAEDTLRLSERAGPESPMNYREMVLKWGYPGPPGHSVMYRRLKERSLRRLEREWRVAHQEEEPLLLISGCRKAESRRRMGTTEPLQDAGGVVWCAPLFDWDKADCLDYLACHEIPRNPVSQLIHKSGECLCGAFVEQPEGRAEYEELRLWYPREADRIAELNAEVWDAGHHWRWWERPPESVLLENRGQLNMFTEAGFEPLCQSCPNRGE